jgi:hypothetical protein
MYGLVLLFIVVSFLFWSHCERKQEAKRIRNEVVVCQGLVQHCDTIYDPTNGKMDVGSIIVTYNDGAVPVTRTFTGDQSREPLHVGQKVIVSWHKGNPAGAYVMPIR